MANEPNMVNRRDFLGTLARAGGVLAIGGAVGALLAVRRRMRRGNGSGRLTRRNARGAENARPTA